MITNVKGGLYAKEVLYAMRFAVVKCYEEEPVTVTSIQINDQKNASITYSYSGG